MMRILGHDTPDDLVVATGMPHTVAEFLQIVCEIAKVDWQECVVTQHGLLKKKSSVFIGDSSKLRRLTGWQPTVSFREMIERLFEFARAGKC